MQATAAPPQETVEELAGGLYAVLAHLLKSSSRDVFRAIAEADLALTPVKALHVLDEHAEADEVCVKDLAEELVLSVGACSRVVDGLHQRGYVERREDDRDRRMKRVRISPAGREALGRINAARLSAVRQFAGTLSEAERKRLLGALRCVLERPEVDSSRPRGITT